MPKRSTTIQTADGTAKASVFDPSGAAQAQQPGVLFYMDVFGLRPAIDEMAERIAAAGFVVLVPDLFYRAGDYGPYDARVAFDDPAKRAALMGMMEGTTQAMTEQDGAFFLDALEREGATGPKGVVGYCFGGSRALVAAGAYPDRIKAAASVHGGNLAPDTSDSPHLRAIEATAKMYIATAGVDRSFPADQAARLEAALRDARIDHIIENYADATHGWTVPDHGAFEPVAAERQWRRLLPFLAEALSLPA